MNIPEVLSLVSTYAHLKAERILLSNQVSADATVRRAVATQIALASNLTKKLPTWAKAGVYIPRHINMEQASSEATALYKQRFVNEADTLLDLTGGMGVDFWAMASVCRYAHYIERDEELYEASEYNLSRLLPKGRYETHRANSMLELERWIHNCKPTLIYVDPARRAEGQTHQRVYAIEDCTPSLNEIMERLLAMFEGSDAPMPRLLVKLSPMLDIKHCLQSIPMLNAITIIAHRSEVKELLLDIRLNKSPSSIEEIELTAVDILGSGGEQYFRATWQDENCPCPIANRLGHYLYEPNAALMKLGMFNYIGRFFNLAKLHQHTHLYTSDTYVENFPGRVFEIDEVLPYQSKIIKNLNKSLAGTQISCRNFPLTPDKLREKLKLKDCSTTTLFATKLSDDRLALIRCHRL